MRELLLLLIAVSYCLGPAFAVKIKKDTMIKIEYLSPETNQLGAWLNIRVREPVHVQYKKEKNILVIPEGTLGKLQITRLGGVQNDIVMDSKGYIILKDGSKITLSHYKNARKNTRTTLKLANTAMMFSPMGLAIHGVSIAAKREINKYNLPKKMFTTRTISLAN